VKNVSVIDKKKSLNKNAIHRLVHYLTEEIGFSIKTLQINFINNEEIRKLNKRYLSHDYTTDILTFDYSNEKKMLDAEIYISLDEAVINSGKYKVSFEKEIKRLVIHGILHLTGYDDKAPGDKKIMKRLENRLLSKINFTLL
jgi:rRNA maturation RNase YbeY